VHHITPLSKLREAHVVDPIKDLIPVCPNCHAMLHINQGEPLSVEQLREILARNKR
jgi:5-methylcytosine-specific restriction protein A